MFHVPSRGLIGYQSEFLTDTRGTGMMNRLFHGYAPYKGAIAGRRTGVLISNGDGKAVAYALWNLEDARPDDDRSRRPRSIQGMIIGEHTPRQRSGSQLAEGQAAHQHPRRRQG